MTEPEPGQHEAVKNIQGKWCWYCTRCGFQKLGQGEPCERCDGRRTNHPGIGATGWWLIKDHSGSRSAVPHDHTILCEESASRLLGTTYLAADVIRFIIAGTLPCQLTGTEDGHG